MFVRPSNGDARGSKAFVLRRRVKGKMQVETLGRYPNMTLTEARTEVARRHLAQQAGRMPTLDMKLKTVSDLGHEFHNSHVCREYDQVPREPDL